MKKTFIAVLAISLVASAQAQFFGSRPHTKELVTTKITLASQGTTNITVPAQVGGNGFAVTAQIAGTNSGTANINVQAYVSADGTLYNTTPAILGDVAMSATSPIVKTLYVPPTTIGNVSSVKITLTNAHTSNVTISNVIVSSF